MHRLVTVILIIILSPAGNLVAATSGHSNRVHLSAEASQAVSNDLLVAELYAEVQANTASNAATAVNKAINWAIDVAKKTADIKVRTLDYNTNAIYDKTRIKAWRASQTLRLESNDSDTLGQLIAQLQQKLALRSLGYQVSAETRQAALNALTDTAIAAFRQRSQQSAAAFGFNDFRLIEVTINNGNVRPPAPYYRSAMMAMDAEAAPAVIEAGSSTLTINVSGTIELVE